MPWDDGLEGRARDFAGSDHSPIRSQAGPGTGKSFALRRRVARLLETGVIPQRILLVTFTRVAARDLERELLAIDHPEASAVRKGTLHSLAFWLLNQANVMDFTGRVPRPLMTFEERFLMEDLGHYGTFGTVHDRKRRLKAFEAAWARRHDEDPGWPENEVDRNFQGQLDEWLRFHASMLIGELVPISFRYLRSNPGCPELHLFDHVLVDEYQDLNRAEQSLVDLLSSNGSLAIVGDEDQSVYEYFRYAHPEGISDFDQTHQGALDYPLDLSRRCPTRIVEIANSLIQNNLRRTGRVLLPHPDNSQGEIDIVQWSSMQAEAEGIAAFIGDMLDSRTYEAGSILILSPRRIFGYIIRDILRERGRRAQSYFHEEAIEGNPKIIDYSLAQKAFTLLNLLANPSDRVSLRCWLGFGSPSLRTGEYFRLREYCSNEGVSPREALNSVLNGGLSLRHITGIVDRYRELVAELNMLSDLDLQSQLDRIFPPDAFWAEPFCQIINESPNLNTPQATIEELREHITRPELPQDVDHIRIMSLHKSKGLTADLVIICGCVEGLLPSRREGLPFEDDRRSLEEQRRLFYLGITRARSRLVLSSVLSLPRAIAHSIGAEVRGGDREMGNTIASTFLDQLGLASPAAIRGEDWHL